MASFSFTKVDNHHGVGQGRFKVRFDRLGGKLSRKPQMSGAQMLQPRPGQRGYFPTGRSDRAPNL